MFNIHNVREQSEITPTALKLEVVMRVLKTEDDEELSKLTGLTPWNVKRCKTLLSFPRKYLDMTLVRDEKNRLSGDFFVELAPAMDLIRDNLPQIAKKYSRGQLTDRMI